MEVLIDSKSSTPVLLPNADLLEMLEKDVKENKKQFAKLARKQKGKKNHKSKFEHRDWIQEHVLEYLKETPCVNIPTSKLKEFKSKCMKGSMAPPSPSRKKRRSLSDVTAPTDNTKASSPNYGLTEAETIQVLNFMPQELVEIHLMVEDLHDRMSEARQEEFLEMIKSYNTSLNTGGTPATKCAAANGDEEIVVDDSIELLEKAGNLPDDDGDTTMKVKDEI